MPQIAAANLWQLYRLSGFVSMVLCWSSILRITWTPAPIRVCLLGQRPWISLDFKEAYQRWSLACPSCGSTTPSLTCNRLGHVLALHVRVTVMSVISKRQDQHRELSMCSCLLSDRRRCDVLHFLGAGRCR